MATTHADYGTKSAEPASQARFTPVQVVKLVVSALVLVALVVFALVNSDDVAVDYLVGDAQVPLIFVILGSAVAGALVGVLVRHRQS